ncbi:Hypothetical_protein [Hexamita inflata]|uniref:Hypothetical_protein n=1 Tax=Hexamita inflata TaxID=28002 RepID=A0AA86TNF7_9EUKA|nr:Hypothetical protein HINF_LOCUS10456 [Hexamita inflata]
MYPVWVSTISFKTTISIKFSQTLSIPHIPKFKHYSIRFCSFCISNAIIFDSVSIFSASNPFVRSWFLYFDSSINGFVYGSIKYQILIYYFGCLCPLSLFGFYNQVFDKCGGKNECSNLFQNQTKKGRFGFSRDYSCFLRVGTKSQSGTTILFKRIGFTFKEVIYVSGREKAICG